MGHTGPPPHQDGHCWGVSPHLMACWGKKSAVGKFSPSNFCVILRQVNSWIILILYSVENKAIHVHWKSPARKSRTSVSSKNTISYSFFQYFILPARPTGCKGLDGNCWDQIFLQIQSEISMKSLQMPFKKGMMIGLMAKCNGSFWLKCLSTSGPKNWPKTL